MSFCSACADPVCRSIITKGPPGEHLLEPYTGNFTTLAELRAGADALARVPVCSLRAPEACGASSAEVATTQIADLTALDENARKAELKRVVSKIKAARKVFTKAQEAIGRSASEFYEARFLRQQTALRTSRILHNVRRWIEAGRPREADEGEDDRTA